MLYLVISPIPEVTSPPEWGQQDQGRGSERQPVWRWVGKGRVCTADVGCRPWNKWGSHWAQDFRMWEVLDGFPTVLGSDTALVGF